MSSLFEAYITNLGKYNEGRLVGETLKFPATTEEVQALLKRIGVDGVRYEEIFITSFDGDVLGLYDHLGEYLRLSQAEYSGADGGVSGGHRPFGAERGKAAASHQPRGQIGRFWSRWPEGKGGVSYRRR